MGVLRVRVNNAWVDLGEGPPGPAGPVGPAGTAPVPEAFQALAPYYQNGWTNYGGAYQVGRFRKTPDNTVQVEGLMSGGTFNAVAFTLPAGYRPVYTHQFIVVSNGTASGCLRLDASGNVIPFAGASNIQLNFSFAVGY